MTRRESTNLHWEGLKAVWSEEVTGELRPE